MIIENGGITLPKWLADIMALPNTQTNVNFNINVVAEGDIVVVPPDDDVVVPYLEARAIAKPDKDDVICWKIDGWNDAHLKDPPKERGANLEHPYMAERTFIPDGSLVHVFPESIKVDGGGRAFVVHDAPLAHNSSGYNIAIAGGLYMKDSELSF